MEDMKIAVVIPKYGLVGGAEGYAYEVTERMTRREGLEIHVFCNQWRSRNTSIIFHKLPLIPFPRFIRPISFAYFARRRIKTGDYDIIHSHDRIFRMDLLTMHGIPHRTWIKEARRKPLGLFDRSMAWVEDKALKGSPIPMILPVSTLVRDELLKCYHIPESNIRIVYPGVSRDRFNGYKQENCRQEIRQRHCLSPHDTVALFVGMNFEVKGLELILKGMADLFTHGDRNPDLKLLVVGKGGRERYVAMIHELGIMNRVVFAGVSEEIEKYYLASDMFVMPSRFDTFGIAVLEAMMAGLPVIITQRVGARDLVSSGVQGFVLPADPPPHDIADKFAVLMNKETRREMGRKAQEVAIQYTWDRTADQIEELYHLLAKGGNRHR